MVNGSLKEIEFRFRSIWPPLYRSMWPPEVYGSMTFSADVDPLGSVTDNWLIIGLSIQGGQNGMQANCDVQMT